MHPVCNFSKLTKLEKINFLVKECFHDSEIVREKFLNYWHNNPDEQKIFDEFSENTITNFYLPYGVVPNLLVNDHLYCVPMVIEESSVVAAAAKSAKFWLHQGGFQAEVISTNKVGQIHLSWKGESSKLKELFNKYKNELAQYATPLMSKMIQRGGGLKEMRLIDKSELEQDYYQIWVEFETCDAMGANFINTILEAISKRLQELIDVEIIMAILSNYSEDCLVKASVSCPISNLSEVTKGMDPYQFSKRFKKAVNIARVDKCRAVTHNKGILNGIDAVVLATGNDFRAVESCIHAYASRDGEYRGLTDVEIQDDNFVFSIKLPISLGTVGGITSLHPMTKLSLSMLDDPSAKELMMIAASIGLAQNFAAITSLVTTGIQKGHMKMHLINILNQLEANDTERQKAKVYFEDKAISFNAVREFLSGTRNYQ